MIMDKISKCFIKPRFSAGDLVVSTKIYFGRINKNYYLRFCGVGMICDVESSERHRYWVFTVKGMRICEETELEIFSIYS